MCATALNLIEHVLPEVGLRQWVLTFPFAWRKRLACDGVLFAALSRIFVESVEALYARRAQAALPRGEAGGAAKAKSGAVTVVQRTSSDLRLNPHLHVLFLDGAYRQDSQGDGAALGWHEIGHLRTREVGEVLEHALRRMARHLRRRGLYTSTTDRVESDGDDSTSDDSEHSERAAEEALAASAVSGQEPPAGPQWTRGLPELEPRALSYDKRLCASLDGFTLHAATRAGALDGPGREALLRYALRPPIAQERLELQKDGLVRISLKRAYADGTVAVDMDPLSLLCRLATSVPPPRHHTVKYAGVLAPASPWRPKVVPLAKADEKLDDDAGRELELEEPRPARPNGNYRPWAELLKRTLGLDALECPSCQGRMKLVALITEPSSVRRYLAAQGELTEVPGRSPSRGPPYWKSTVLRRKALGHDE